MDVPVAQQILPRRQAAKQASANITQQLDDSDSDTHHAQNSPSPKRVIQYGRKAMRRRRGREPEAIAASSLDHDSPNLSNATTVFDQNGTATPLHDRRPKKRPFSQNSTEDALDSPLTPVSDSDPLSTSLTPPPTSPFPPSLASRPFPLNHQTESRIDNNSSARDKRRRQGMVSRPKKWKKNELGEFVWVLIDDRSRIFDHNKAAQEREHVWWPAKIRPRGGKHLYVFLYGQMADIKVSYPTEDNISPFDNSTGGAKFLEPTFVTPSHRNLSNVASPRKKAKRDRSELVNLWNTAVHELNVERDGGEAVPSSTQPEHGLVPKVRLGTSDDENLPAVGGIDWKASLASIPTSSQASSSPTKGKRGSAVKNKKEQKGGRREATPISDESDFGIRWLEEDLLDQEGWFPAPADETLLIPGELVLAKGTDGDKNYWPAKVLEYIPQKSKREKEGRYKIEYLDNTTTFVKRSAFFTPEEDEFATCKLGQIESSYDDAANDSDAEDLLDPRSQNRCRSPTPPYPPPSQEAFIRLDVRSQFVFTKPILVAILNEQYPPARERHDKFLKGGQARKSVVNSAGLRGEMEPRSVMELQGWLCEWCLRDERSAMDSPVVNKDEELKNSKIDEMMMAGGANEDAMEFDAGAQPLSAITDTTSLPPEGRPDSLLADSCMENTTDQLSPLSSLSNTHQETTPTSVDNNIPEPTADAMDTTSDLTESENLDAHVIEMSTRPPRQYGCPMFEALTKMEKLDYCLNVLLPEAVIQILLWRKGLRTAMDVLSPVEEQQLHDEGMKLLEETDWVYDVLRLRHAHERRLAKKSKADGLSSSQKSERGRLRNVGRVNYFE